MKGQLLGLVLRLRVKLLLLLLLLLGGGGLRLGGEIADEERRPEGWVEGEATETAGGDREAA